MSHFIIYWFLYGLKYTEVVWFPLTAYRAQQITVLVIGRKFLKFLHDMSLCKTALSCRHVGSWVSYEAVCKLRLSIQSRKAEELRAMNWSWRASSNPTSEQTVDAEQITSRCCIPAISACSGSREYPVRNFTGCLFVSGFVVFLWSFTQRPVDS